MVTSLIYGGTKRPKFDIPDFDANTNKEWKYGFMIFISHERFDKSNT